MTAILDKSQRLAAILDNVRAIGPTLRKRAPDAEALVGRHARTDLHVVVLVREHPLRGALEHGEVRDVGSDGRRDLEAAGPGTDERHPLAGEVDVVRFEQLVAKGRRLAADGELAAASATLGRVSR